MLPDLPFDLGYVQFLCGFGGFFGYLLGGITQAGWLPGAFFDATLGPGASGVVIGVTHTFVWLEGPGGSPTDIDNNGREDVALREIYYNNAFQWGIDPEWPVIDTETIVLHETGHGLSQNHFGKLFRTDKNGRFHFAPRALMNAGYTGIRQTIEGTGKAGHCSIWGAWPNN
jgi:hypothetical protein